MSGAARLYTPAMLALAVELARWPLFDGASLSADARSATCGSTISIQLVVDRLGRIGQIGMRARACAVGQAAAAIFARHAPGQDVNDIGRALSALEAWLANEGPMPDWPDLSLIAAARDFPGRHGAMLLPWKAASHALSNAAHAG